MELSKQVTSLELSKKLKELGVKQESYFVWFKPDHTGDKKWQVGLFDGTYFHGENEKETGHYGYTFGLSKELFSAFTVAELGEMLPEEIYHPKKEDVELYLAISPHLRGTWQIQYSGYFVQSDQTEADARAKMLIYLLENKLITF